MQNPSVLTTRATRKTTRIWVRDAKYNAAGAMHRVAWALQNSKGTGLKCGKPWENQGFAAEMTGFEQPANSMVTARFITPRDAKYDARKKHDSRRLETRLEFGCATRNTTPQALCTELH
ncbi:MAG: hypothetical protein ACK42H_22125, partial [Planctomycetota bacterium]